MGWKGVGVAVASAPASIRSGTTSVGPSWGSELGMLTAPGRKQPESRVARSIIWIRRSIFGIVIISVIKDMARAKMN